MDGLVLDTEPTYFIAWQRACRELGYFLSDKMCSDMRAYEYGKVEQKLQIEFDVNFPIQQFRDLSARHWRSHINIVGINTKPGFDALYGVLNKYRIPFCLATNSRFENTVECLKSADILNCFPEIVTLDQVNCGKPQPDLFLEAAKRLGISPHSCLALEDSYPGIRSAKDAGTIPILIHTEPEIIPDAGRLALMILHSLEQAAELVIDRMLNENR